MNIAAELEVHAQAGNSRTPLVISNQIDYLGGMPAVVAKPVKDVGKKSGGHASFSI